MTFFIHSDWSEQSGHARNTTNTDQYGHDSEKTKETNGKTPHDNRPEERRANDFKHTVQQQVKQYQKDHKHDNNNQSSHSLVVFAFFLSLFLSLGVSLSGQIPASRKSGPGLAEIPGS